MAEEEPIPVDWTPTEMPEEEEEEKKPTSSVSVRNEVEAHSPSLILKEEQEKKPTSSLAPTLTMGLYSENSPALRERHEKAFQEFINGGTLSSSELNKAPDLAKMAIDCYNKSQNEKWKFVVLFDAMTEYCSGVMFFLTFIAMDENASLEFFQAKVLEKVWAKNQVFLCRKKNQPNKGYAPKIELPSCFYDHGTDAPALPVPPAWMLTPRPLT